MVNIQLITMNNMTQLVKLCMSTGTKVGLAQKGHNLMECKRLSLSQRIRIVYVEEFSDGNDTVMSIVS